MPQAPASRPRRSRARSTSKSPRSTTPRQKRAKTPQKAAQGAGRVRSRSRSRPRTAPRKARGHHSGMLRADAASSPATAEALHLEEGILFSVTRSDVEAEKEREDFSSMVWLVVLYGFQGIITGLVLGSLPILLKRYGKLSYSSMGIFNYASIPYSVKLLWSPIVDSVYSTKFGRRKTWILPVQTISVLLMLYASALDLDELVRNAESQIALVTLLFFFLMLASATQDIAVDGWAVSMLSRRRIAYAGTTQTVGLNIGYFTSFTVFLFLHSAEFWNSYVRDAPTEDGVLSLSSFVRIFAAVYALVTVMLLWKRERPANPGDVPKSVAETYRSLWRVLTLPSMKRLAVVLLTIRLPFAAAVKLTPLKLLENGFGERDLVLIALLSVPFEIIFAIYCGRWAAKGSPLRLYERGFLGRCAMALVSAAMLAGLPASGMLSRSYYTMVVLSALAASFLSNVMFTAQSSFYASICDDAIGGSYLTLLNTLSNFGSWWTESLVLFLVDYLTVGGIDGYYTTSAICLALGLAVYFGYTRGVLHDLDSAKATAWSVASAPKSE